MQDAIGRQPMPVPGSALVTYSGIGARLVVLAPALTQLAAALFDAKVAI